MGSSVERLRRSELKAEKRRQKFKPVNVHTVEWRETLDDAIGDGAPTDGNTRFTLDNVNRRASVVYQLSIRVGWTAGDEMDRKGSR